MPRGTQKDAYRCHFKWSEDCGVAATAAEFRVSNVVFPPQALVEYDGLVVRDNPFERSE
jgi:hypothetical protein